MHPSTYNLLNGITGITASAAGVTMTLLQQVEQWLRIGGAAVGLIIALITLWNLTKPKK